ncbi:telomere-protecting terminal protein Tpg [Streptomyces sp. NPDC059538]|uniref:telomere-protecting terminal protein Tpg n=1 Tax=Streptomyces sp. NPDC059538 TaxID=3346860 RepID=UPI0036C12723
MTDRIVAAVRARRRPEVRDRRRKEAATRTGITVETRARSGHTEPIGTIGDGRMRRLSVRPAYAQRLFGVQQQGAGDAELRAIVAQGLQGTCSRTAAPVPTGSESNSPTSTASTCRSQAVTSTRSTWCHRRGGAPWMPGGVLAVGAAGSGPMGCIRGGVSVR